MANPEKFVIFDGNALLHRAFHALPPLTTRDGQLVNAAYGFTSIFLKVLKDLKPSYVAVTFDRREPTFRHQEFKDYKAQRVKQPQELYDQVPIIKDIVGAFGVPIFEAAGYEADDVIGTVTAQVEKQDGFDNVIVTGDLDTLQLVDDRTVVYTLKRGLGDTVTYGTEAVKERYGLTPKQMIDFKALRGDPSDNIPGIRGIGEKTALELIKAFGSIDGIYSALKRKDVKLKKFSRKVVELLSTGHKDVDQSKRLVTIVRDVKLDFSLERCRLKGFDMARLVELFHKLEFKSLLARLPELQQKLGLEPHPTAPATKKRAAGKQDYTLVHTAGELDELMRELKEQSGFTFDTETTSLDVRHSQLLGISLAWEPGRAYFIQANDAVRASAAWRELAAVFKNERIEKSGHNLKYDIEALTQIGIAVQGLAFDTLIAAYLLRSGERVLDLKSLVFQELGVELTTIEQLIGPAGRGQKTMAEALLSEVVPYACADADFTLRLKLKLEPELKKLDMLDLFYDIEMPLVPVLAWLERAGVKVDIPYLDDMAKELRVTLKKLEQKIHRLAGREFNINSPKQLKAVLFDELKISPEGLRHTKTGVSTAASELEKMRGLHPIIEDLFEWRELSKLLSTYVEAIPELVDKVTGRVYTSFNQTVTATGRLSSSDPNLQNIPIRGDWGRRLRRAFVAEPGYRLVSADYSQIELRIVAHLAQDKRMIEIFKQGQDIHSTTAAFIFGVKPSEVTADQRRSAKEVNFGVLYGMGPWGLAERTGISRDEARDFIERYFTAFAGVAKWIEHVKDETREHSYATTLFGRRRALPEINSGVAQVRNAAERMAVNLPTQGTAADLMKVAMVKVAEKLPSVSPDSKMILQVHDELVFEVPEADVPAVAKFVQREMEQAVKLSVPIVVDVKVGENWGEMEEVG